jgi:hypothetical protein
VTHPKVIEFEVISQFGFTQRTQRDSGAATFLFKTAAASLRTLREIFSIIVKVEF